MPRETKRYDVRAINQHGLEVSMSVVERAGTLVLLNGLDQQTLSQDVDLSWNDLEREVKRVSGVTRLVLIPVAPGR